MLQRRQDASGVVFYVSPHLERLGVKHAFSTRLGGISPPPFDSLNLGNPSGSTVQDDYARIWRNYDRLHSAIDCPAGPPLRVHQVHGAEVLWVRAGEEFDTSRQADALVSSDGSRVLSIRVADCVPALLARRDGQTVAAVHAGWRGVVGGVAVAALRELAGKGPASEVYAAIGPCIGYDDFEVGPEVLDQFRLAFGSRTPMRQATGGKGYIDLRQALLMQLTEAGVPLNQIDQTDRCTYRHRDEFFSHRRDGGVTGRMAGIIQACA